MKQITCAVIALGLIFGSAGCAHAADAKDAMAAIDRAISVMGGQEKLSSLKGGSFKIKATISSIDGEAIANLKVTFQGIDRQRFEFDRNNVQEFISTIAGDKGWEQYFDRVTPLSNVDVRRREAYLLAVMINPTFLKDNAFKIESATDEGTGDRRALSVRIIGPDSKDFTIFFDKETGLPVKSVAKLRGRENTETVVETTYREFKEINGIKRATHANLKEDGHQLVDEQCTDFQDWDKTNDAPFARPKEDGTQSSKG